MPFVCLCRTHITGGGLPSAIEVWMWGALALGGLAVKEKGRVVKV
jgi:hypothetical protein